MPAAASMSGRFLRRHWSLMGLLLLCALIVYLVGNNLFPLVDRDEPRYALASREMLRSGDWTIPTNLGEPRLKKPILIYWLQAKSMKWFGETPFAARLPSVLASVLTLGILALALPRMIGHRRTLWATFILATALLPAYLAKVCMTDAVLHVSIAAAMLCLYAVWRGTARWPTLLAMGVAIGISLLTKGPPVFLFLGTTLIALWALNKTLDPREPKQLVDVETEVPRVFVRALLVLGIALLVCLPWVRALEARHPGGLGRMFMNEVVMRGAKEQEGHGGPPGYYFVTFWATYFPWCLLWPAAIFQGWKRRQLPWVRFSLAAVIGPWVFLELYKTKLPHYWLPSYPFMAILTADALLRGARGRIVDLRDRPFIIATGIWAGSVGLLGLGLLIIPFFGDRPFFPGYLAAMALAAGVVAFAWGVFTLLRARQIIPAAIVMGLGFWAILAFATTVYWPSTRALTLAPRTAAVLREIGATSPGEVQMIQFKEPSLAFYQGGTIREQSENDYLLTTPHERWPRWTVITDDLWKTLPPPIQGRMILRRTLTGSNFADGDRRIVVHVLEKKLVPTTLPHSPR